MDRHARSLYVCLLSQAGARLWHRHRKAAPVLQAMAPDREGLVVAVEGLLTGYGLADLGAHEGLAVVLGPALSRNAIHGGQAHHERIDAHTIAVLRRGGLLPQASIYPAQLRATRALLRRRTQLRPKRAARLAPGQHTHRHDNRPELGQQLASQANRQGVAERCAEPAGQKRLAGDLRLIPGDDPRLTALERSLVKAATHPDANPL